MDNNLFAETSGAVKEVIDRFGIDILSDHKRFCSAFSDFAPRLNKENKAFFVVLSENIGDIFIAENDAVLSGEKSADSVIDRAVTEICEYLNNDKAELISRSIALALGWSSQSAAVPQQNTDEHFSEGIRSSLIEDLFRRASKGDNDACFNLGERFFYGRGVKQDYIKAVKWYTMSSDRGDCSSQKKLADCYYLGQGAERNVAKAAYRYEQAAEQGDYDSQKALIRCYTLGGNGLMPDKAKADYYSQRYGIYSEADTADGMMKRAQNGDPEAQFRLGGMYLSGAGVEHDPKRGIYWLKQAADNGYAKALFDLGCCYFSGTGVPRDKITAVMLFGKAADLGDLDAVNNLGGCCLRGDGTPKDQRRAADYYRKAAEMGHPKAQYNYGECCFNGWGVPMDRVEAAKWFKEAALQNDPDGQYSYGWCLANGDGVRPDAVGAKRMFEMASMQRHPSAQKALGYCYTNGTGTAKNFAMAAELFGKAASSGDMEAAEVQVACYKYGGEYLAPNEYKARRYAEQYGLEYDNI